jgi:hypothetical protein
MINLDFNYSDFIIWGAPGYPGGKAFDTDTPDSIGGTPYKADWMNDINGFFQALIVAANGSMHSISGNPDSTEHSDRLNALFKVIENIFGRVPTVTKGPFIVDISQARRYQLFFIGSDEESARVFLPDISAVAPVNVVEVEIFNTSTLNLKIMIYPESEFITLTPGGWVKIRPYSITAAASRWGHSFHYVDTIVPLAPVKYDAHGRLKAARPQAADDVLRLADRDIYAQAVDFFPVYQIINANTARIEAIENAMAENIYQNPFIITFPDLEGVDLVSGSWDEAMGRLDCSYAGSGINITFTNLNSVNVVSGIWDMANMRLEC